MWETGKGGGGFIGEGRAEGMSFGKRDKEERLHIRVRGNGGEEDGYVKVIILLWDFVLQ